MKKAKETMTYPCETDTSQGRGEYIGQYGRIGIARGKIGVELWRMPMGHLHTHGVKIIHKI